MQLETLEGFSLAPQQRELVRSGVATTTASVLVAVEGALDPAGLEAALAAVITRHEILRTSLRRPAGVALPVQVIAEPGSGVARPAVERLAVAAGRVADLLRREAAVPADLESGPLVRAVLAATGEHRHALVLTLPLALTDAWSLHELVAEIAAHYAGDASSPGDGALQYADFAEWQNDLTEDSDEGYWEGLPAAPPPLLPWGDPAAADGAPEMVRWRLPAEAASALGADDASLEAALLAAWSAVLARRSRLAAITVGSEWHGRRLEPLQHAQGPVARVLPVVCRPLPGNPFATVARQVADALEEGRRWSDQFEGRRGADRGDCGHGATFAWRPRTTALTAGGTRFVVAGCHLFAAPAPVHLVAGPEPDGGALLEIGFHPAALPAAEAGRLAADLDALLRRAAGSPGAPLGALLAPGAASRHGEVVEGNDTAALRRAVRLDELVTAAAQRRPDDVAALFADLEREDGAGDVELRRGELETRAGRLATELRRRGAGPGFTVGLLLDRSPELLAAMLAVWRAGAAYVALDPTHPDGRLAWILEDSGAALVLTRRRWAGRLPAGTGSLAVEDAVEGDGTPWDAPTAGADDPAYVVYTSGSSGRPKGIAAPHRGAVSYLGYLLQSFGLGAGDRVLQVATPAFDASLRDIVGSLAAGSRLVVLDDVAARTPGALLEALRRYRVTAVLSLVPTLLREILTRAEEEGAEPLPDLRLLLLSGEALYAADVERVARTFGSQVQVVNQYGPSETTMTATFQPAGGLDDGSGAGLPVGRPIPNVRLLLLDAALRPVSPGMVGEVYLGGVGVTRGYLRRPALTAERFLPDAGGAPGARLYRSGDMARRRPDGGIDFLGRVDQQIKLRGLRIEPGEIEAAMRRLGAVEAAAVAPRGDGEERRLIGYFVAAGPVPPSAAELRRDLAAALPDYLIPATFVRLDELPRTASGKVDRNALPEPTREAETDVYVEPRNPQEDLVAAIWADILKRTRVGVEDDFFVLGGHSLIATRVVARVGDACGVELPLQSIFDHPTVAGLSTEVERLRAAGGRLVAPAIETVPRDRRLPLSAAQKRVWFQERLRPGSPELIVPELLDMEGRLDRDALRGALHHLSVRHEMLRTRFHEEDGELGQEVLAPAPRPFHVIDLGGLPEAARMKAAQRDTAAFAFRPFDLAAEPGWRAGLLALGTGRHRLMVSFHYLLADGWSSGIFSTELIRLYSAFSRGEEARLPELPVAYADYAVWQRRWLREKGAQGRLEEFWRRRVTPPPPRLALPADNPAGAAGGDAGAVRFELGAELSAAVLEACRRWGATPFMVLLAAWQALLARLCDETDVTIGTLNASRSRPELEGVIGHFVNNLVLRTDLGGDPSFAELVARGRRTLLDAFHHQELPVEQVEALYRQGGGAGAPFQALFVFQNVPRPADPDLDLEARPVHLERRQRAERDLALAMESRDDRLVGTLRYNTERFGAETAGQMVDRLRSLLAAGLDDPARRLSELPLLLDGEDRVVLEELRRRSAVAAALTPEEPEAAGGEAVDERLQRLEERQKKLSGRKRALLGKLLGEGGDGEETR